MATKGVEAAADLAHLLRRRKKRSRRKENMEVELAGVASLTSAKKLKRSNEKLNDVLKKESDSSASDEGGHD